MRDHDPITFKEFLGTFDRDEDDSIPPGFFRDSKNVRFITGGVKSREGSSLDVTLASVKRMFVYKRIGEAQRLLLLDAVGQLWDSTNLVTPILSIAAMSDFSVEVMFNRAYITPHNGVTGLPGEKVYVYEGSGVARAAAGTAPTGFSIVAADAVASGNCETGIHVFAVCFETTSGFLTKPGGFVAFSPAGGKKVDLSNVSVGPASTTARQIVATKVIEGFTGDFENQEYFIVPNGRLAGNVATTISVSFYDADLQSTADYLLDQLPEIPAGVGIRNYGGHLCVWGEDANSSIVRVSKMGEPESHDAIEGYLTVNPGDSGGGVSNVAVYRKQMLCFKAERTYATVDNGQSAAFWGVDEIDLSLGTTVHGVARIRDFGDNTEDRIFIVSRPGLQLFNGTYSGNSISWNIDGIWQRINDAYFHTIQAVVDPNEALVYVAVPLDEATSPSHVLVADYQDGFENIKWTIWTFPVAPTTIMVDVINATKKSVLKYAAVTGNVYKLDTTTLRDFNNAITAYVHFPHVPADDQYRVWHFGPLRVRAKGAGNLDITIMSLDDAIVQTPPVLTLAASPGQPLVRGFNLVSERCSVKLGVDGADEWFRMTNVTIFAKIEWETRPQ